MCLLIIGGMILSSVAVVGAIARGRPVQSERQRAVGLAEQLMTEIMQCAFQDPDGGTVLGRDAGETGRATYDDVDDYEGWEGSILTRKDGTPLAGYDGWKRRVKVTYVTPGNPNSGTGSTVTSLKRIVVTVITPSDVKYELVGLRSVFGAYEEPPPVETNYLTWAGVAVRVGDTAVTVHGGAHPLNVTSSQP